MQAATLLRFLSLIAAGVILYISLLLIDGCKHNIKLRKRRKRSHETSEYPCHCMIISYAVMMALLAALGFILIKLYISRGVQ